MYLRVPCPHPAGSPEKIRTLEARAARGLPLHVAGDCLSLAGVAPPGTGAVAGRPNRGIDRKGGKWRVRLYHRRQLVFLRHCTTWEEAVRVLEAARALAAPPMGATDGELTG